MWSFMFIIVVLTIDACTRSDGGNIIDICDNSRNKVYAFVGGSQFVSTNKTDSNFSRCQLQLLSCPACVISLKIWFSGLLRRCQKDTTIDDAEDTEQCNCDRIEITEPMYKVYSRQKFCARFSENASIANTTNPVYVYRSLTRGMNIVFTYSKEYERPFTIEFTAKHNIHHIDIIPDPMVPSSFSGIISTPFFPMQYLSDLRLQYNIKCSPKIPVPCHIKLVFTDHQLAPTTVLELFERRRRIGVTSGRVFRPPILVSEGPTLTVNFYANKASNYGFRANYSVILTNEVPATELPKTVCGGYIRDNGGAVTMIRMVEDGAVESFDCVWIIRPLQEEEQPRTHLLVRVIEFNDVEPDIELEIHKGSTSQHKLLQRLVFNTTSPPYFGEHIVNVNTGFYISLRGSFNFHSRLVISYAVFSFSHSHELGAPLSTSSSLHDCYQDADFECRNHRCIPHNLQCDGLDHCGDRSDEAACDHGLDGENTNNWRLYTKNYYFPSVQNYPGIPNGFFIAFGISLVTFFICSLMCSVVYKIKHQIELNNQLRSIRQIMVEQRQQERYTVESTLAEEPPPEYDFPPSYHDVIICNSMKKASLRPNVVQNSSFLMDERENAGCSTATMYNFIEASHFFCRSAPQDNPNNNENISNSRVSSMLQPLLVSNSVEGNQGNCRNSLLDDPLSKSTNNVFLSHSPKHTASFHVRLSNSTEGLTKFGTGNTKKYEKLNRDEGDNA